MSYPFFPRGNWTTAKGSHEPLATTQWTAPEITTAYFHIKERQVDPIIFGSLTIDGKKHYLGYDDDAHATLIAGSRAGKGVSIIIPNLLYQKPKPKNIPKGEGRFYKEASAVVIDLKGEISRLTATFREDTLRQQVYVLDPFQITGFKTACLNLMASLDPQSITYLDDIRDIVEALIEKTNEKDAFWDNSAKTLVTLGIYYVMLNCPKEAQHLITVYEILMSGLPEWNDDKGDFSGPESLKGFLQTIAYDSDAPIFEKRIAKRLLSSSEKQLATIHDTVSINLEFLESPAIANVLSGSSFPDDVLRQDQGATIYLVLPERRLARHNRFFRLAVQHTLNNLQTHAANPEHPSVQIWLDEMPAIGYLKSLERASGYIAGFKVNMINIFQDLNQAKAIYPKTWETFLGNSSSLFVFGNNDLTTQKYISERLGQCETFRINQNYSGGESTSENRATFKPDPNQGIDHGGSQSHSDNWSYAPTSVSSPLMRPEEVGRYFGKDRGQLLALFGQGQPVFCDRIYYYRDEVFKDRAGDVSPPKTED